MKKSLLLINDIPGYGKVALSAMFPILSHMGFHLFNLPTALVSNTLDYGKFDILDTTDYMRNSINVWKELHFEFDAVSTGFIVSAEQVRMIRDFCGEMHEKGVTVFTDPIMGDEGHLYNGVSEATIGYMRDLISIADYIVPNYTEACLLTNTAYRSESLSSVEMRALIDALREMCSGSVVITSIFVEGSKQVCGYDHKRDAYFSLPYQEIPVRFPGTGDIFSAVFEGRLLKGDDLKKATADAMKVVYELIARNQENPDKYVGLPIESNLSLLDTL